MTDGIENVHICWLGDRYVAWVNWAPIPGVEGASYDALGVGSTVEDAAADAIQAFADASEASS